jgi:hypothetical protein
VLGDGAGRQDADARERAVVEMVWRPVTLSVPDPARVAVTDWSPENPTSRVPVPVRVTVDGMFCRPVTLNVPEPVIVTVAEI